MGDKKEEIKIKKLVLAFICMCLLLTIPCPAGDLNGDYGVDLEDLLAFTGQWLDDTCCSDPDCADLNGDCAVNFEDFAIFAANWGEWMEIIAHRGASYLAPENTLAAVNLAWEKEADAVEIDLRLSKDSRVIVIHDETTGRTAWGGIDLEVSDTNSDQLRAIDVGRWKGPEFAGEKIPFLEEIVDTVSPEKELLVEIKCGTEILPFVQQIFEDSGKESQMVVSGFELMTMTSSKQLMPDIPTYWIRYGITDEQEKLALIQTVEEHGLDGLFVHYEMVTETFMDAVEASDQGLDAWTVNDPNEAVRLYGLEVDGIVTDRPGWLTGQLE